jgi:RNA polymerase sigma-70 factor (ECF subfamily)
VGGAELIMSNPIIQPAHPMPTPDEVIRAYGSKVYNLAYRMLGSAVDAEDVTQEVLLTVVRKLHTFRGESSLGTWLHRITVNACLAFRRKRAVRAQHEIPDPLLQDFADDGQHAGSVRPWSQPADEQVMRAETQRLIEHAISELPEAYRDVYVLADVEGLPNAEIADLLGLNVPGVKSRLHRARLMMRKALARHFQESES